jgi:hypothetical protein
MITTGLLLTTGVGLATTGVGVGVTSGVVVGVTTGVGTTTGAGLSTALTGTASTENKTDKTVDITGDGNLYFIYDFDYGTLSSIYDYNGVNIIASFSNTDQIFSSPTGLWAGKRFYVYKYDGLQVGPPSENYIFQF